MRGVTAFDVDVVNVKAPVVPNGKTGVVRKIHEIKTLRRVEEFEEGLPQNDRGRALDEFHHTTVPFEGLAHGFLEEVGAAKPLEGGGNPEIGDHAQILVVFGNLVSLGFVSDGFEPQPLDIHTISMDLEPRCDAKRSFGMWISMMFFSLRIPTFV